MSGKTARLLPSRFRKPSFSRNVYAVAGGLSVAAKARADVSAREQLAEAVRMLFRDNDLKLNSPADLKSYNGLVQSAYFSDHFEAQVLMSAIAQDTIGWNPTGGWRIEAGGATGGSAVHAASMAVASGVYDYALVLGWEKMSMVSTPQGTEFIALASDTDFDFELGGNYTGYYASLAHEHIANFGTTRMQMAKVAVKNRNQAQFNPFAQTCHKNPFRTASTSGFTSVDKIVRDNRPNCSPLHVSDCCTMSDAASAMLICSEELAYALTDHPIRLKGIGSGTDTMRSGDRAREAGSILREGAFIPGRNLLLPHENEPHIIEMYKSLKYPAAHSFLAGRVAAIEAYRMAEVMDPRKEIKWFEMHDAFSSSELQAVEDFGLAPFGQGGAFIDSAPWDDKSGRFQSDFPSFGFNESDRCHLTISGGLIGARHGIGDTGVFQNIDTFWRLQGKIKKFYGQDAYQPHVAPGTLAADHSHAGTGAIVVISIWERPDGLPEYQIDPSLPSVADQVYERLLSHREIADKGHGVRVPSTKNIAKSDVLGPDSEQFTVRSKNSAGASILHSSYKFDYYKTRGRISPFFDGLAEGKLIVTYCPKHGIFIPPISTCRHSDCLDDISENWTELTKSTGRLQTWTTMQYTGPSFKGDTPFHNVLVEYPDLTQCCDIVTGESISGLKCNTSIMSRLILPSFMAETDIYIGMPVRPKFNTSTPTGRITDMWYEPAFSEDEWLQEVSVSIPDNSKASNSEAFWRDVPSEFR
jgi:acetyl-CoA C-acetyltransferase